MLRIELAELQDADFDLDLIGFDEDALADLLAEDEPEGGGLTDDDAVPEVEITAISRPGDVWSLGDHRVLCGDATVTADYKRLLGDELADLVFTDPPYNVAYAKDTRPIHNDALGSDFGAFLESACGNLLAVTKGAIYVCMSSSELDTLQAAFRTAGGKWSTFIACEKAGRRARLIELDEVLRRHRPPLAGRWQEYTGRKATRSSHKSPESAA
jgi:DNA modification methylase